MRAYIQSSFFGQSLLLLIILPLVLMGIMGNFPERSILKESLSVITILCFFQLIGQFFWARTNRSAVRQLNMGRVLNYHKCIGYSCVAIMLFHPLYIVIPRFFEAGVSPADAFITMVTTMNTGVVLGIVAWCLMLVLTMTSLIRSRLPMSYKSWRILHGILALLFLLCAVWHVIDLGRHATLLMSLFFCALTAAGIVLLLKRYIHNSSQK